MSSQPLPRDQAEGGGEPRTRALAVNQKTAAAMLSVSVDTFTRRIASELRVLYVGRLRLYPVRELELYVERTAERPLDGQSTGYGNR